MASVTDRMIRRGEGTVRRKCAAMQAFRSQPHADPSTGAPAILGDDTLARAARPFELVFA